MSRGTSQGGAILSWMHIGQKRAKVVAYTDELVSEMFPAVMNEIMEGILGKVHLWDTKCGLGENPIKTELMPFPPK